MIKHLQYVAIPVSDLKNAAAFYTEKLEFQLVAHRTTDASAPDWVVVRPRNGQTNIALISSTNRYKSEVPLLFETDDLSQTYNTLVDRGVRFVKPPEYNQRRGSAIIEDPDGNRLVLTTSE